MALKELRADCLRFVDIYIYICVCIYDVYILNPELNSLFQRLVSCTFEITIDAIRMYDIH